MEATSSSKLRLRYQGCAIGLIIPLFALILILTGCSRKERETPEQRANAAKALFDQTTKQFDLASAAASGAEKQRLLTQAAAGYERLLKAYPEQEHWAAQALRNLAGIKAVQGNIEQSIQLYAVVANHY